VIGKALAQLYVKKLMATHLSLMILHWQAPRRFNAVISGFLVLLCHIHLAAYDMCD
jgi:hypothetical protein